MTAWKKNLILLACGVATCALVPAASCNANGLFGWLRARRAQRQAYYAPTTVLYGGSCCQPCQTCQPACQPCQQVVAQYAPQTCYRNSWTQVAVTNYRPVQSIDPCTGCPVTVMQPCTSYRWAVQRVPYTTMRPVYTTVAAPCSPCGGCATGCSACNSGCSSCSGGAVLSSGGCSSCVGAATTMPSTTVTPGNYYQGGTTVPSGAAPAGTIQGGSVPADTVPSLSPSAIEGTPSYRLQPSGSSSTTIIETETDSLDITPIPDLYAPVQGENRAPQLLNEDDRRASRPMGQAVPAHLITWSRSTTIQPTSVELSEPAPAAVELEEEMWDDSGWEAVR